MRYILLLILLGGAASAQTARFRNTVFTNVARTNNIAFGSATDLFTGLPVTLLLDRYEPAGDASAARPAVVVIHGGGFTGGDKADPQFQNIGEDFARRGYVAVSINYRLAPSAAQVSPQVQTAAKEDGKAAVRFLSANAAAWRIDTGRIAVLGSSAGAMTGLQMAYVPGEGNSGNPGWSSQVHALVDLWGSLSGNLGQMEAGEAPLCIIHGTNDPAVPYSGALALAAQAQLVGVPYELHPLQGAGHAPWNLMAQFRPEYVAFLYEHLALGQLSGLAVRPGFASPGTITLDSFGVAGDTVVLAVAANPASLPVPPIGVLCLDPAALAVVSISALPATPRLPAAAFSLALPPGLGGLTGYWQGGHATPAGAWRWLTNCAVTAF